MQSEIQDKLDFAENILYTGIISANWKIGDQIPTERENAVKLGYVRGTGIKAMARRTRVETSVIRSSVRGSKGTVQPEASTFCYA